MSNQCTEYLKLIKKKWVLGMESIHKNKKDRLENIWILNNLIDTSKTMQLSFVENIIFSWPHEQIIKIDQVLSLIAILKSLKESLNSSAIGLLNYVCKNKKITNWNI